MGKIAIIDADIVGKKKHRFPNLCCMKLSTYYKNLGYEVIFGTFWVSVAFYFCLDRIKKCYFRKLNILNKRVHSIHLLYEVSSMKIEDLN